MSKLARQSPFVIFSFSEAKDWKYFLVGLIASFCVSWTPLISALLLSSVFNKLQMFSSSLIDKHQLLHESALITQKFVALAMSNIALNSVIFFCMQRFAELQSHNAMDRFMSAFLSRNFKDSNKHKELLGILSGMSQCTEDLKLATGTNFTHLVQSFVVAISCILYSLWSDAILTLVTLSGIPVIVIAGYISSAVMSRLLIASKLYFMRASDTIHWTMKEITTVKLSSGEETQTNKLQSLLSNLYKSSKSVYWNLHAQEAFTKVSALSVFTGGLYYGLERVQEGHGSIGNIVKVLWCSLTTLITLSAIPNQSFYITRGTSAAKALLKEIGAYSTCNKINSERIGLYRKPSLGWIKYSKVFFKYSEKDSSFVLKNCFLELHSGRLNVIVGKSGSGKSTIAQLLLKLQKPTCGDILIDGCNIESLSSRWIHDNIVVMDQNSCVFSMSIRDNILLGARSTISESRLKQIYAKTRLTELISSLPDGDQTIVGRFGISLSGGQKQRLSLARVLAHPAQVVVLDEPTSALDKDTKSIIMETIRELAFKKTVIMITHDVAEIHSEDYIHVLNNGLVCEHGPFWELMKKSNGFLLNFISHVDTTSERSVMEKSTEQGIGKTLANRKSVYHHNMKNKRNDLQIIKQLLKELPNKLTFCFGVFSAAVSGACGPAFSFIFSKLLSTGIDMSSKSKSLLWLKIILAIIFTEGVFLVGKGALDISSEHLIYHLRLEVFNSAQYQPLSRIIDSSSLLTLDHLLMNELEESRFIISSFGSYSSMVAVSIGTIIFCLCSGWKLSLVAISLIPLLFGIFCLYKSLSQHCELKYRDSRQDNMVFLQDILLCNKSIKIQGLEYLFRRRIHTSLDSVLDVARWKINILCIPSALGLAIPILSQALVIFYGIRLVAAQSYNYSQLVIILVMIVYCYSSIEATLQTLPRIGNGYDVAEKALDILRTPIDDKIPLYYQKSSSNTSYFLSNVSFHFPSKNEMVLKNINLHIETGEVVAITGPSGCGKSTLLYLFTGLFSPSSGNVFYGESDLNELPSRVLQSQIAVCGQMPLSFFNGSIKKNVTYGLPPNQTSSSERHMVDLCKQYRIHDVIMALPEAYDTVIGGSSDSENSQLSGGQMQRLGIIRALLRRPKVLILDEVTSALDPLSTSVIVDHITKMKLTRQITVILITHEKTFSNVADRQIYLPACSSI